MKRRHMKPEEKLLRAIYGESPWVIGQRVIDQLSPQPRLGTITNVWADRVQVTWDEGGASQRVYGRGLQRGFACRARVH